MSQCLSHRIDASQTLLRLFYAASGLTRPVYCIREWLNSALLQDSEIAFVIFSLLVLASKGGTYPRLTGGTILAVVAP